jgi:ribosome-associated protein
VPNQQLPWLLTVSKLLALEGHKQSQHKQSQQNRPTQVLKDSRSNTEPMQADINNIDLKAKAIAALEDVKGIDITVIDVTAQTDVTDYMIVATGTSNRHVKSLANNVVDEMLKVGIKPHGVEGLTDGEWVLVDLVDVVVHVMLAQTRKFYEIERLWSMSAESRAARGDQA